MTEYPIPSKAILREQKERILERIYDHHLRKWSGSQGNVFFISDTYPGVWLEHMYDGVAWADYMPEEHEVSKNHCNIFLDKQLPDGQLPCYVWEDQVGYAQIQECVSVGSVCLEAIDQNVNDPTFLSKCYESVKNWVNWHYDKRMTMKTGLVEVFCGYDTGHDLSLRHDGFKYEQNRRSDGALLSAGIPTTDCDVLPVLAPDLNANFYGNHMALAKMADCLGRAEEAAQWRAKAEVIRKKMMELLWDEEDQFFYDVDKQGRKRKLRSIYITNVLGEGVLDDATAEAVMQRYILNPKEFWTPYPMPAVSSADPRWIQNAAGNSWNFYAQGLTALRTLRWMPQLGHQAEMEEMMRRWVSAWSRSKTTLFGQELHPITGEPSVCSQWYSSCMLYYLHAIRRLYDV